MVTIQEVARKAGVAPITVSRVVNRSGYVADQVRKRVEAAIEDLGYVPNTLARSLRSRRTNMLALVLTDITNPFFTTVAGAVEAAANEAGFMLIVCNTGESEAKEQNYLQALIQRRVDGILLVPAAGQTKAIEFARKHGTPMVVLDRRVTGLKADSVRCDSEGGAYSLGQLLLSLGHRQMAVLTGPAGVSTSDDRVAGFQRALNGDDASARCAVYRGRFTQDSGRAMALEAMRAQPRPTALFAANNFIAIGALNALRELEVEVPGHVSLVGFDDLPAGLVTFPFLTVASQPAAEMGRKGVELMIERLTGGAPRRVREVVLPTSLVVRRSTGLARGMARLRERKDKTARSGRLKEGKNDSSSS